MTNCVCGRMKDLRRSPYILEDGHWLLPFKDGFVVKDAKCLACGGNAPIKHELTSSASIQEAAAQKSCSCGSIERWIKEGKRARRNEDDGMVTIFGTLYPKESQTK